MMTLATHYSPAVVALRDTGAARWKCRLLLAAALLAGCLLRGQGTATPTVSPEARAAREYQETRRAHQASPTNSEAAWHFARACFAWAEFAPDDDARAKLAEEGIKVSRALVAREPKLAAAHYYLGMNLGQLARTKSLGALPIVDEMEKIFKTAAALDKTFSHGGPDRNLGLLYLQAPSIGSIGSRSKARIHLQRAIEIAPDYPENRLNWIEACLRWRDYDTAREELKTLDQSLDAARARYSGEQWARDWADWDERLQKARARLDSVSRTVTSPRGTP